jgi:selenocysteine-specific elongation factor
MGIVDVPGHEKLVRTMISGATGFQLALWVVDAREGLMPQSVEHLEVLDLLGAAPVLPVVTKADLASESEVQATLEAIDAALGATRLGRFPTRVVDSLSGRGIGDLAEALFDAGRRIERDPTFLEALAFMPIDRCFVLKGVGTVVTGTLVRGTLRAGESIEISSSEEPWRIRSLHNHSAEVATLGAGHRVGVHLHGIRAASIDRGDILVSPGYPFRSDRINVDLQILPDTLFRIKHGMRALFLAASYEMECRLWGVVESRGRTFVQIQLPRETCFYSGQRFILRSTNPLTTVGGGTILDLEPDRLRRLTSPEVRYYENPDIEAYVQAFSGGILDLGELETRWMRREGELVAESARNQSLHIFSAKLGKRNASLLWHEDLAGKALDHLDRILADSGGKSNEWPLSTVARALGIRTVYARAFLEWNLGLERASRLGGVFSLSATTLRYDPEKGGLSPEERKVAESLARRLEADGLRPSRLAEYASSSGAARKTFDKVTASLLKDGTFVRIDNEWVLGRKAWTELRAGLLELPEAGVTPAEFGQRFGLTRKYSMPYIECLNRMGMMRRRGDRHEIIREKVGRNLAATER